MKKETSGIILTAAKADVTVCEVFGNVPSGLIPVNGKPIIFFILQQFLDENIKVVYIGVDYKSDKIIEIVNLYFKNRLTIHYVFTDQLKGVGNSLLTIIKEVKESKVVINLGDTYIRNTNINSLTNHIIVSNDFLDEEKWATVETYDDKTIKGFSDKKSTKIENQFVLTGVYVLDDVTILSDFSISSYNLQMVDILDYYHKKCPSLNTFETDDWMDFGHIDKYYSAKKKMIQSREFNFLEFDDLLGTITKKSKNIDKFKKEIEWQLNLPNNLKVIAPRVLDYSTKENPFITMEFYSYPTLSEIWLFSEMNKKVYFSIIDKLFKILNLFKLNKKIVKIDNYLDIYVDKTIQRVNEIKNENVLNLLQYESLTIHGKTFVNWQQIDKTIFKEIDNLYNENDNCLIHGDFCLSNILYDLRSGLVRLIDPRGVWGDSENGDIKYDVAKLRHSICSDYDYIVNDLFSIDVVDNEIQYKIYSFNKSDIKEYFDNKISESYSLEQVKLIEGLLFLSMIPLHSDSQNRQLMMYIKAIELLNEVLISK